MAEPTFEFPYEEAETSEMPSIPQLLRSLFNAIPLAGAITGGAVGCYNGMTQDSFHISPSQLFGTSLPTLISTAVHSVDYEIEEREEKGTDRSLKEIMERSVIPASFVSTVMTGLPTMAGYGVGYFLGRMAS